MVVLQVYDVVYCLCNEEIYFYLYIIIYLGGIRYIGGNFFIMKKKCIIGVCGQLFIIYILFVLLREDQLQCDYFIMFDVCL